MRILLSNDDGISAPGLQILEEIAAQFSDDVWICAPHEEQSGAGHSLSLNTPVRLHQHGPRRFSVTGTPTDSVILALRSVLDNPPDVILSGVNRGANLADDITYSGTVAAAMEGALAGIPAIALSQVYSRNPDHENFNAARQWGAKTLAPLLRHPLAARTLINVNFPPISGANVAGIRAVRQGSHGYSRGTVIEKRDPRGSPYYWFGLQTIEQVLDHGTDLEAIDGGFVSVTPLQLDITHHASIGALTERYDK